VEFAGTEFDRLTGNDKFVNAIVFKDALVEGLLKRTTLSVFAALVAIVSCETFLLWSVML
jgi:hypothetical protein